MTRSCIICGERAGSAEHVFPAALGGRRKNKAIYCHMHNNAYSPLVAALSQQLEVLNSLVGVRPDRSKSPKAARGIDITSGRSLIHTANRIQFAEPHLLSETLNADGSRTMEMAFPDRESAQAWISENGGADPKETVRRAGKRRSTITGATRFSFSLGGELGLRAVAYLLQTYLAQGFPSIARSAAANQIKAYTLGQSKGNFTRWNMDALDDQVPNRFDFGHRIVVGVAPDTGQIFGRLSLFSEFHFSVNLGRVEEQNQRPHEAKIIDIDPLAEHPPNDIHEFAATAAEWAPDGKAESKSYDLRSLVQTGGGEAAVIRILERIKSREASSTAADMDRRLRTALANGPEELAATLNTLRHELFQRVYNMLACALEEFAATINLPPLQKSTSALVELDPSSANGLTPEATVAVMIGTEALLDRMESELHAGTLTERRIVELIAEGPGMAVVARAALELVLPSD